MNSKIFTSRCKYQPVSTPSDIVHRAGMAHQRQSFIAYIRIPKLTVPSRQVDAQSLPAQVPCHLADMGHMSAEDFQLVSGGAIRIAPYPWVIPWEQVFGG